MKLSDAQNWMVIITWISIIVGFLLNPAWFGVGIFFFVLAMIVWSYRAYKSGYDRVNMLGVWLIPTVMVFT